MVPLVKLDSVIWAFPFIVYYNVYVGHVNSDVGYLKLFKSLVSVTLITARTGFQRSKGCHLLQKFKLLMYGSWKSRFVIGLGQELNELSDRCWENTGYLRKQRPNGSSDFTRQEIIKS